MREKIASHRDLAEKMKDERRKMTEGFLSSLISHLSSIIYPVFSMVALDLEPIQLHGFGWVSDVGFVNARVVQLFFRRVNFVQVG